MKMNLCVVILIVSCLFTNFIYCSSSSVPGPGDDEGFNGRKSPTVFIACLIRNKAHTLPYFLSYLEKLDYPKNRLALWFRSDHNEDNSIELINIWLNRTSQLYHNVDFEYELVPSHFQNETSSFDWTNDRFSHIIRLKEEAFEKAQELWADYIFFVDADVILTNENSLKHLVSLEMPIVAPMLLSDSLYSNFWGGMSSGYYYKRTEEYQDIYKYKTIGHFNVPMVHSAVLIDLRSKKSQDLTYDRQKLLKKQREFGISANALYQGPLDDIIIFAISAKSANVPMYICNDLSFGYILQPAEDSATDLLQLTNIKLNIINDMGNDVLVNDEFKHFIQYPEKDLLFLDHIYMINLERRPERRRTMHLAFNELGLDVENFSAVDGKTLNLDVIKELGIKFMKGYEDPYHRRQMTMGEIGCFLSHYRIWQQIVELGYGEVLVLEDDIRFEPYFRRKAKNVLEAARRVGGWDLIYFGRKRLENQNEPWVTDTDNLVHVGYSYWTLGYVITLEGARKLLDAQPLKKLIPVDEYLPIMFDRHPNDTWASAFFPRDLQAYSAAPLIMFPTKYTGEDGYISDTEDSEITTEKLKFEQNEQVKELFADDISKSILKSDHNEL